MKKCILPMLLSFILSTSASVCYADDLDIQQNSTPLLKVEENVTEYTATPTTSKILVDGTEIVFEAYNIKGNNFFKLRDLAMALTNTSKKFDLVWLEEVKVISLLHSKTYTPVGGELLPGDGTKKIARVTETCLDVSNCIIPMELYNINGNNFFKLRDIGLILNFSVEWDGANNCVIINTNKPYEE